MPPPTALRKTPPLWFPSNTGRGEEALPLLRSRRTFAWGSEGRFIEWIGGPFPIPFSHMLPVSSWQYYLHSCFPSTSNAWMDNVNLRHFFRRTHIDGDLKTFVGLNNQSKPLKWIINRRKSQKGQMPVMCQQYTQFYKLEWHLAPVTIFEYTCCHL